MRYPTPFGEVEVPREPKDAREQNLLIASLQGSYEVMSSQGYSQDDINKFAVTNWMECVGIWPTPRKQKLVEVVEGGRKFMRLE